jgi:hypothetical protein
MAYLRLAVSPQYALIYVDDPKREKSPWSKGRHGELIRTGTHQVLVVAPGFRQFSRELKLAAGQKEELNVKLERVDYGELRIDSNAPKIQVSIDGEPVGSWSHGEPALSVQNLSAGPHRMNVTAEGRKPLVGTVEVPKGQVQPVRAHMVVTPPRGSAWTQAVLSGVMLGGSIYLGLESNRLYDDLNNDRSAGILVNGDSRASRGKWFAIGADLALVGSAALGAVATYNFIRDPLPPSQLATGKIHEFDSRSATPTGGER